RMTWSRSPGNAAHETAPEEERREESGCEETRGQETRERRAPEETDEEVRPAREARARDLRSTERGIPGREVRPRPSQPVRADRRNHSERAVYGQAREHGHTGALRSVSQPRDAIRGGARSARGNDQEHGILSE